MFLRKFISVDKNSSRKHEQFSRYISSSKYIIIIKTRKFLLKFQKCNLYSVGAQNKPLQHQHCFHKDYRHFNSPFGLICVITFSTTTTTTTTTTVYCTIGPYTETTINFVVVALRKQQRILPCMVGSTVPQLTLIVLMWRIG